MRAKKFIILLALGALSLFIVGTVLVMFDKSKIQWSNQANNAPKFEKGKTAPELELMEFGGARRKLSDYKGKAVIIDVWASWSPYALEEMYDLQEMYVNNIGRLVVLGIHRTDTEREEKGLKFVQDRKITYPIFLDTDGTLYKLITMDKDILPVSIFIDSKSIVREIKPGRKSKEEISDLVNLITQQ